VILLSGTGLSLLALQLAYVQLNDTYVVGLVPFALVAVAARINAIKPSPPWLLGTVLICCVGILATTLWMRKDYDRQQAAWNAADRIAASGIPYHRINGPKHWAEYHGAFDDWIRAGAPGIIPPPPRLRIGQDPFHDPFYSWLNARNRAAVQSQAAK